MVKIKIRRHLVKTISYRVISTCIGFCVIFISTGSIKIGAAFSSFELIFKPIIYFLHERFYYKYVKYGVEEK